MLLKNVQIHKPSWHKARAQGIGASESSAFFPIENRPHYQVSLYTLARLKRGEVKPDEVFVGDRKMTALGLHMEPAIAAAHADLQGWKIKPGGYMIDDHEPRMRCSRDFEIAEPNDWVRSVFGKKIDGPGSFQIKTVIMPAYQRHWSDTIAPEYVRIQVQQEIACAGQSWGMIGVMVGGLDLRLYPILGSQKFGDRLRRLCGDFWQDAVVNGNIPQPDGSESTRLAINSLHPPRDLRPGINDFEDDRDLDHLAGQYDGAKAELEAAMMAYNTNKNRIAAILGDHKHAFTRNWWIDRTHAGVIRVRRRETRQ